MTDSANLELVRSIYADLERGDFSQAEWAHPDIEYTLAGAGALPNQTWHGLAGLADAARFVIQSFENWSIRADEYRELDGERILVLEHRSGQGKGSGLQFDQPAAHLFQIHDGQVTRLIAYMDCERALADLGVTLEGDTDTALPEDEAEIVARTKAIFAAYNRRDWDAFFAQVDPEFEWAPVEENVSYRGRAAIIEYLERWLDAWEEFRIELEHLDTAPARGRSLATARYQGKNATIEVPIEGRFFQVVDWREGKPWCGMEYADETEARAAFEQPQRLSAE